MEEKSDHIKLAGVVKSVHAKLRKELRNSCGKYEEVWQRHIEDRPLLERYADSMLHLATDVWEKNPETRIDWCRKTCIEYFHGGGLARTLEKDRRRLMYLDASSPTSSDCEAPVANNECDCNTSFSNWSSATKHEVVMSGDGFPESVHRKAEEGEVDKRFRSAYICGKEKSGSGSCGGFTNERLSETVDYTALLTELGKEDEESSISNGNEGHQLRDYNNCSSKGLVIEKRWNFGGGTCLNSYSIASSCPTNVSYIVTCHQNVTRLEVREPESKKGDADGLGVRKRTVSDANLLTGSIGPDQLAVYAKYESSRPAQYNTITLPFTGKIRLLDVGSCYNPFKKFEEFLAIGIDLQPAVENVFHCDFLYLETLEPFQVPSEAVATYLNNLQDPIERLPKCSFHVVVFSLLLEYFPSPHQRWICCEKAQHVLLENGLLLIITPDSHQQYRNAPIMKSWRTAIESLGFARWRYVKQEHLHCMAFRKVTPPSVGRARGAGQNGTLRYVHTAACPEMLYIPQDSQEEEARASFYFGGEGFRSDEEDGFLSGNFEEMPELDAMENEE